jgi:DNA-binding transcriptional ArsR family regulator
MTDSLSATFAALADPTRRAILARVSTGETSVGELARPFDMSLPAISKHLKVLERAGLIVRGREAQWRPCRLQADPLKAAAGWIDEYRHHWENNLDALGQYLEKLHGTGETPHGTGVPRGTAETPKKRRRKKSGTPTL